MYNRTIKLEDCEVPAKINKVTGEIKEVNKRPNNIPDDKEFFEPKLPFYKAYDGALEYITDNFNDKEVATVIKMITLASRNTNYLKPLHAESTIKEISEVLGMHRNSVNKIMDTLYQHGIYSKASTMTKSGEKHWLILNPYVSFKGKTISSSIIDLFQDTLITDYVLSYKR